MKHIFLFLIFTMSVWALKAQDFRQAAGIRLGLSPGFEYRIFSDDFNSYRFLLSTRGRGAQIHLLKEFHRYDLFNFTDQLVFLYGAGVHAGYERWDLKHYDENTQWYTTHTAVVAGMDGLAGLEYRFYRAPVSLGIEVKPYFEFFGKEVFGLELFDFGFTARYLF